jgi:hypothetical protein
MVDFAHEPTQEPAAKVVLKTKGDAALWVLPLVQKIVEAVPEETSENFIETTIAEFSEGDPTKVFAALQTLQELVSFITTAVAVSVLQQLMTPPPESKP